MRKTDLDKPDNVPLPANKPIVRGQKYITYPCPFCELNDKFKVLETVIAPFTDKHKVKPGQYRCACTACGYETVITSKSPTY